jgi:hypothetical protein
MSQENLQIVRGIYEATSVRSGFINSKTDRRKP